MKFETIGPITKVQVIAAGPGIRVRSYLRKAYGQGRWRKLKGIALVRLPNGAMRRVEFIGTRRMASGREMLGSSATWMSHETNDEAVCAVHR